ncbi:MAG: Methyltransferase type 11 [Parcubacteria group bacterium GW2011_GWF2_43_11]|nr:MAG: Methyltransferase type 11 [Parcubacteria group bacterium GW2011_GWF2_43_11]
MCQLKEKHNPQEIFNNLWKCGSVQQPKIWSLWKITKDFEGKRNLELGAGNCPRIPVKGGYFLDTSGEAMRNLERSGGISVIGDVVNLPFENNLFDLLAGFEVLEHIENDEKAFSEIARVLKPSGFFLFSVPLRQELFNEIDLLGGHKRRYEVAELEELLSKNGFRILKYRGPSFYIKIFNKLGRPFIASGLRNGRVKNSLKDFILPRFIFNLHYQILSFFERKGAPKWQTDTKDLSRYKENWIVMLCQKNE